MNLSSIKFEKFLVDIPTNISFSAQFFSHSGTQMTCMLDILILAHSS